MERNTPIHFVPPKHIISAATIVVNDKNEILLIKGPKRGWEMPGGQVEEGESIRDAAIRETKEESGIEVEIVRFCGIFQNVKKSICNTLFLAKPIGGELTTSSVFLASRKCMKWQLKMHTYTCQIPWLTLRD